MKNPTFPEDLEIALMTRPYTCADWKKLNLCSDSQTEDWDEAISVFRSRIEGRFLEPVDVLIKEYVPHQTVYGFAILAIDFLVIETLQGFRKGLLEHKSKHKCLVKEFLKDWSAFKECLPKRCNSDELAGHVYEGYRCGIAHTGATDGAFRVRAEGPTFDFNNYNAKKEITINRTCFHKELKREFASYCEKLANPNNTVLRCNFIKKMNAICGLDQAQECQEKSSSDC